MPRKQARKAKPAPPSPDRGGSRGWTAGAMLIIIALGCAVYANSLRNPFVFDDQRTILDNTTIRDVSLNTVLHPQPQTPVAGRPLANLSFALNYAAGGLNPAGYHVWNLAIHILAALVLFGILRRTMASAPSTMAREAATARWALACALMWLVHPLNTEVVDYLTQRTEAMVALCLLTTLYASIRSWDLGQRRPWQAVAIVANVCGMATKESMAVAPLLVLLCDRAFAFPSWRSAFRERSRFYAALAAGWLLLGVLLPQTPFISPTGFETRVSPWTYLLNQAPLIVRYLRLSVWPSRLVLDYGFPQPLMLGDVWASVALLMLLAILTVVAFCRLPRFGFWAAWFFITLAPASSIVPIPSEVGAERRMYLPLIAVIVLIASAARLLIPPRSEAAPAATKTPLFGMAVGCAIVAALGVATVRRNAEYRTGISIWETVLDRRPNPRAHENLAVQLRDAGRVDDAILHLRAAAPDIPEAQHALGSALIEHGQVPEGIAVLKDFVTSHPRDRDIALGREELGAALLGRGDFQEAIGQFQAMVNARPGDPGSREVLATVLAQAVDELLKQRRFTEAEADARTLVSLQPNDAQGHNALGVALASQGRIEAAGKEFAAAVRLNPGLQQARDNLDRAATVSRGAAVPR